MADRMFHVIVLGGLALTGCGGSLGSSPPAPDAAAASDAGSQGGFEDATPGVDGASVDAGVVVDAADGGFPSEGPQDVDTGLPDGFADVFADAADARPHCSTPCVGPPR